MKKLTFLLLALCLSMGSAFAEGETKGNEINDQKMVLKQLNAQFNLPSALVGKMMEESVVIKFKVLDNHQIQVLDLDCLDSFTAIQLKKELEEVKIYLPSDEAKKEYQFKLWLKNPGF